MIEWLKHEWNILASIYTEDNVLISNFWSEIEQHYTSKNRHYHNLSHIYHMLTQAEEVKASIVDYDGFRFSIWYHDIIYKATKKDNEEKSAEFAKNRLKSLNFDEKRAKNVEILIKSTQKHDIVSNENEDNAFLLDIDLSILGTQWEVYHTYIKNIRKEYIIYPYMIYKKGRKKAMQHFIERQHIYFTQLYRSKLEKQARHNIEKEINLL